MIRRERTPAEYHEKINYSLKQVDRLYHLVEQFLVLSRFQNDKSQFKKNNFDIKNEILNAIERFQLLIDEKQLTVNTNLLKTEIITNNREITEIITDNILINAIKYSKLNGTITISSFIKNNHYHLTFDDNGIGIKEEDLKFIQDRFFRIKNDDTPKNNGFGLGLSIASELALLTDIKIIIESQPFKGTKVYMIFNTQ